MAGHRKLASAARLLGAFVLLAISSAAVAGSDDETRAKIRKQSQDVLTRLYAAQPSAREAIAKSRGYATFSKWGLTLGPVGGGIGKGLAVQLPSHKETFMRYVEGSAGLGLGVKKYALVFVFATDKARSDFVDKGWQAGAQATAAAKSDSGGKAYDGAVSVSPGMWVYQITEKGLAAEVGLKGTKYYKDQSLN